MSATHTEASFQSLEQDLRLRQQVQVILDEESRIKTWQDLAQKAHDAKLTPTQIRGLENVVATAQSLSTIVNFIYNQIARSAKKAQGKEKGDTKRGDRSHKDPKHRDKRYSKENHPDGKQKDDHAAGGWIGWGSALITLYEGLRKDADKLLAEEQQGNPKPMAQAIRRQTLVLEMARGLTAHFVAYNLFLAKVHDDKD